MILIYEQSILITYISKIGIITHWNYKINGIVNSPETRTYPHTHTNIHTLSLTLFLLSDGEIKRSAWFYQG